MNHTSFSNFKEERRNHVNNTPSLLLVLISIMTFMELYFSPFLSLLKLKTGSVNLQGKAHLISQEMKKKVKLLQGCRDGVVVRALASHQCGPGSIPRSGVICGLSLLVLYSTPSGFLRVLRFPLSSKTKI